MMMCWNCRGMGSPSAIQQLKGLAREINPDIICLVETLVKEEKIKKLQKSLGFCNGIIVNPIGRSGGIAVLYKDGITMEPLHASNHIISGKFSNYLTNTTWIMSLVYGHPVTSKRKELWDFIENFGANLSDPWVLWGDFNSILSYSEKQGGNINRRSISEFKYMVDNLGLIDLGYKGNPFTWKNNRIGKNHIRERLDRVLATNSWFNIFPKASVSHLTTCKSDHNALVLDISGNPAITKRPFRFLSMWTSARECEDVVREF
ncbi:hypothetical protein ACHQM5_021240 [Ranunculus cassubicifolius]